MTLRSTGVMECRFRADVDVLQSLRTDENLTERLERLRAAPNKSRLRAQLLSEAVRVDVALLPSLAAAFAGVQARAGIELPLEAYVFSDADVNAFITQGRTRLLVALSSGAVNRLGPAELEFVIGHELGHAAFGHVDLPVGTLIENPSIDRRTRMMLAAWQRHTEISADRVGLLCCGTLDTAAAALFKTISGLQLPGVAITAVEFARQWDALEEELRDMGSNDWWSLTHPFPPLRVKAMIVYDRARMVADPNERAAALLDSDRRIERLLAFMDPLARRSQDAADPVLVELLLWAGMYLLRYGGDVEGVEQRLRQLTGPDLVEEAVADGSITLQGCLERFDQVVARRRQRLRSAERARLVRGVMHVADCGEGDGPLPAPVVTIAARLGVSERACNILARQMNEDRDTDASDSGPHYT